MKTFRSLSAQGISVVEGMVIGPVHIYSADISCILRRDIPPEQIQNEIRRFLSAHSSVAAYYATAVKEAEEELGEEEAAIFRSHLLILNDPYFTEELPELVKKRLVNAEWLVSEGVRPISEALGSSTDPYLRERATDVEDVAKQLLHHLLDVDLRFQLPTHRPVVVMAKELTPSDIIKLKTAKLKALVTDRGTSTSHTAIVARSLGIPVIMGVAGLYELATPGDTVIVDGNSGIVHLNPSPDIIKMYHRKIKEVEAHHSHVLREASLPAETIDGVRVTLLANIVQLEEAEIAMEAGAEGIGLFRTEMPFLEKGRFLVEDEQYEIYRAVVEQMGEKPVVIRTLDLGGDKLFPTHDQPKETNPFLGRRSIRLSLHHREMFKHQLRAILRASAHGQVQVMFPMISTVDELRTSLKILGEVMEELAQSGVDHDPRVQRGIMVEVPSAVVLIDALLPLIDFVSIGTNDLTQYTLAVDRNNPKVVSYYRPADPAVLRLIRRTTRWAKRMGKPAAACGEVAGSPSFAPLLVGLGVPILSMTPKQIPEVKHMLRHTSYADAVVLSRKALKCSTAGEVENLLAKRMENIPLL